MKVWPIKTAIVNILRNEPFSIPKKSLYLTIRDKTLNDVNKGLEYYKALKINESETYDFSFEIGDLISTAKYLQRRNKFDDAIRVFQHAVQLDAKPKDLSYGYQLIGDCYRSKSDILNALTSYQKALALDAGNINASTMATQLMDKKITVLVKQLTA
jgi:tetratricopeptide (TPR) repeat protein